MFCENCRIPMYALDDEEKTFDIYQPENPNKHCASMVFRISNGHFYPVENVSKRKTISHQNQIRSDLFETHITQPVNEKDIDLKTVSFQNDIMSCLKQHISGGKVPSKLEIHSNNLTSYWIDNIQYVNNTYIELNKELCENMGNVYEGQGTGTLLFDIAENTTGTIPKSTPNNYFH